MKSLTGSLLPRRWAGRGGAEPSLARTKGAAGRGRKGVRAGEGVGDVTSAGCLACSETPPPGATQSDPTQPDPRRRHPAPGRPRASRTRAPLAEEAMDPRCPNPPAPRTCLLDAPPPGPPSPRSAPSPVRSCGRRRGPSVSRCPLPRLRLGSAASTRDRSRLPAGRRQRDREPAPTAPPPRFPLYRLPVTQPRLGCDWTPFNERPGDSHPFSAPVTRPHAHTFRAVIGVGVIGALWDQSTTPLLHLVVSLVKRTEGGNSRRPLILLACPCDFDPSQWGNYISPISSVR